MGRGGDGGGGGGGGAENLCKKFPSDVDQKLYFESHSGFDLITSLTR